MVDWLVWLSQALGLVLQGVGVAILFAYWQRPRGPGRAAVALGWALIFCGIAPWLLTMSWEKALALGMLAPSLVALGFVAWDGRARVEVARKSRPRRERAEPAEIALPRLPGRFARGAARWFAVLVAAPALGVAAAALWQAFTGGGPENRMVFSILTLILVWAFANLWLLGSPRPWRHALIACALAVVLGGAVYGFGIEGAA